jgi:molybdopterin converting factor small subunit
MKLNIKLFAAARDLVERDSIEIELRAGATVADLRRSVVEQFPKLRELVVRSMFAIDCEYATNERIVPPDAQLALIPPVSGG